ncbi:tetratricopeptide repeat protein [Dactylosporangium sp. NPDC049525]|uniref:ATP-binding protein n=1 Tax=Dactylosporangium sp. NPDC049525 TaxID=3154730 RepID=UPI0034452AFE
MVFGADEQLLGDAAGRVETLAELAGLLRALRRRHARRCGERELSYRTLAARTGWSHTAVAEYFTGKTLPPTDRFDVLVDLLGAGPAERGALATARDRVHEQRRGDAGPAAPQPPALVPRQLPPAVQQFSGRCPELAELTDLAARASATGPVTVAITGTAGIGKTALALHWAHRMAGRYPDGQLYLDLRGFDPSGAAMPAGEALSQLIEALGVPPQRIPPDLAARAALLRTALAGRRMLIVLDNARDSAQTRPLLPGTPGCLVVVTSRNQLPGLVAATGAHPVTLDLLRPEEATELLLRRVGPHRGQAGPAAIDAIVARCAGLPLALALVAARAATRPRAALSSLAAELRDARTPLDALDSDEPDGAVRTVFWWSYRALRPAAARLFRLLGLHPGGGVPVSTAASLAGLPVAGTQPLLAELVLANLLTEHTGGRYLLHDLLRAYATERVAAEEPDDQRAAAVRRMIEHYLHTAYHADLLLGAQWEELVFDRREPGVVPEPVADRRAALEWFTSEQPVLLRTVALAVVAGLDAAATRLAWTLTSFLDWHGQWAALVEVQQAGLAAAERAGEPAFQAHARRGLARAYTRTGRYGAAHRHLAAALELSRRCGDPVGQGQVHLSIALVLERQERYAEALDHARRAFEAFGTVDNGRWKGRALNVVGWYHALLGDHAQALTSCRAALELLQDFEALADHVNTWDSIGFAQFHLHQFDEAITSYREALDRCRHLGDRHGEAMILGHLGDAHRAAGAVDEARAAWQRAAGLLDDLHLPDDLEQIHARLAATGPRSPQPA